MDCCIILRPTRSLSLTQVTFFFLPLRGLVSNSLVEQSHKIFFLATDFLIPFFAKGFLLLRFLVRMILTVSVFMFPSDIFEVGKGLSFLTMSVSVFICELVPWYIMVSLTSLPLSLHHFILASDLCSDLCYICIELL